MREATKGIRRMFNFLIIYFPLKFLIDEKAISLLSRDRMHHIPHPLQTPLMK